MGKHYLYRFLLITVLFFLAGCSTEKNTTVSRFYNNLTSHYNIYFNGKESLKSGVDKIDRSVEDDYSKILPMFKSSNPTTAKAAVAEMENAVMKGSKLIQSHSITKKPKRRKNRSKSYIEFASRDEFNNWVDDAYILMGEAYFYQHNFAAASENFSYVVRRFDKDPSRYTAYVWLIRCFTEQERFVEAFEIIQQLQTDEKFPHRLDADFAAATADYYARQLFYKEGLPFLINTVKETSRKLDKLRFKYILAQWYQETGDPAKASQTFREIARKNPPYKMAFNAKISAAGTFTGLGDVEKLKKELRKMLRDKKNAEFSDQIYFAMGNISMKEGQKDQAIKEYTKSASMSVANLYQRALSCLTLAQIYYEMPEYKKAQSYYDSAMVVIDDKYPNYRQIYDRHKSLTRLTDNIYTVEREDSLQKIAKMDESARNTLIDKWIKEVIDKENREKMAQQQQMADRNFFRYNQTQFGSSRTQTQGSEWYFYNPTTVAYGKVEFERLWGKRKLEDNWRRFDKRTFGDEDLEQEKDSVVSENGKKKITDKKTREYYTQNLPLNDSLLQISHGRIRNALFNAGRIFKTEFNDVPRSIASFEDLNQRYPENMYVLSSWFELWDLYKKLPNQEKADFYKNLVVSKYPESKYAKYLLNPNYFIELEARNDSVNRMYRQAFSEFKAGDYAGAGKITDQIMKMKPDSLLVPKITFIKIIADGTASTRDIFGNLLKGYIAKNPKAEPKPLAEQILKLIQDSALVDYQKLVASGYLSEKINNKELLPQNQKAADEFGGKFSYDEDLLHYFVIAYPKNSAVDVNRLKFDLANYNIDHYTKYDFDIETQSLNPSTALLLVRSLKDKEQGLIYFRSIIKRREVFQALKNIKYVNFIASSANFREITADKDYAEYLKFFIKNYSRFITGDFSDELLPEPEELLAKAQREENAFKEKGTYVTVAPTGNGLDIYADENSGTQSFVIAVNTPKVSLKQIIAGFSTHNADAFKTANLNITQSQVDDYQLMMVGKFKTKIEAINYFTKTLVNRKLFKGLDTLSYRTFIINDANLRKLSETKKIAEYLNFFKIKYIDPESVQQPPTDSKPGYSGPYVLRLAGTQNFVLIVPNDQVNQNKLTESIRQFNRKSYAQLPLTVSASMLDDFRLEIKVEGLPDAEEGVKYLRAIVNDKSVYGPLETTDYRHFIITPENEAIFRQSKNILIYMDFYKHFYLK